MLIPALSDSRRLTGPNLHWNLPAAIIDCAGDGDLSDFIAAWRTAAQDLLAATGRTGSELYQRVFEGGASLLISAPIDALYSMCELNEAAFALAAASQGGAGLGGPGLRGASPAEANPGAHAVPDLPAIVARLTELFTAEANPALLALQQAARAHEVPFLWDDELVSLGYGASTLSWEPRSLPATSELEQTINWARFARVPVALVTGTNGKSTTVRMAAAILKAAGLTAGLTSTDWIRVGDTVLDEGDYSGTGGARRLLREPRTQVAVLETARGGLLRRGLAVESAEAALITNVAADHLGEYGIQSIADLVEAKLIVRRALGRGGLLVLNADDPNLATLSGYPGQKELALTDADGPGLIGQPQPRLGWFSLTADNPVVQAHLASGGAAAWLEGDALQLAFGGMTRTVLRVSELPAALGGAARHNLANALGAMLLCAALGVDDQSLHSGLTGFHGDSGDNPGRGNCFEGEGLRVLVDFAHNEHGMRALAATLRALPGRRRLLMVSTGGDRSDADIAAMVRAAQSAQPDLWMLFDIPGYERGRAAGEIPAVFHHEVLAAGVPETAIRIAPDPLTAAQLLLAEAVPGDLLGLLGLTQREEILAAVRQRLALA